jgi:hypothetical protein
MKKKKKIKTENYCNPSIHVTDDPFQSEMVSPYYFILLRPLPYDFLLRACELQEKRYWRHIINPLTPEINPSAQRCLPRFSY